MVFYSGLLKVPLCLRAQDWKVKIEATLMQTRLDVCTKSAEL